MPVETLLRKAKEHRSYDEGETVFTAGEFGEHMFGVISGSVDLCNEDRVVATKGPGEMFGELALVDREPRSLTAVATTATTLAVIDRHQFLFLIHETPTFAIDVMHSLAVQLRALTSG